MIATGKRWPAWLGQAGIVVPLAQPAQPHLASRAAAKSTVSARRKKAAWNDGYMIRLLVG